MYCVIFVMFLLRSNLFKLIAYRIRKYSSLITASISLYNTTITKITGAITSVIISKPWLLQFLLIPNNNWDWFSNMRRIGNTYDSASHIINNPVSELQKNYPHSSAAVALPFSCEPNLSTCIIMKNSDASSLIYHNELTCLIIAILAIFNYLTCDTDMGWREGISFRLVLALETFSSPP